MALMEGKVLGKVSIVEVSALAWGWKTGKQGVNLTTGTRRGVTSERWVTQLLGQLGMVVVGPLTVVEPGNQNPRKKRTRLSRYHSINARPRTNQ